MMKESKGEIRLFEEMTIKFQGEKTIESKEPWNISYDYQ